MAAEVRTKQLERLTFIYNADSGAINAALDSVKKALSLESCALCQITHGLTAEKSEWRQCTGSISIPIEYLHRNELPPRLLSIVGSSLPAIVAESDKGSFVLVGAEEIKRCAGNVSRLRSLMDDKARGMGFHIPGLGG